MKASARESETVEPPRPGLLHMIRAPFLSAIVAPLAIGTLIAVIVQGRFDPLGAVFAVLMGLGLHIATNVYNDIHDDIQGTDRANVNRNEFSGGSGVLQSFPDLRPRMLLLARGGLVLALVAACGLQLILASPMRETMWVLFGLGAFFSKYYSAEPVKLASRGLGEVSVWFAFGPMAILLATIGQGVWLEPAVLVALPITGFSTVSIQLIGQLIDLPADRRTGKLGLAARVGTRVTTSLYLAVQLAVAVNVALLASLLPVSWPPLIALIPTAVLLPAIWKILRSHHAEPRELIPAAGLNIRLHLSFSILLALGLGVSLALS